MFRDVADIQTADMLNLPVPEAVYETIIAEPSDIQRDMVAELSERAVMVQQRAVEPEVDNMLRITTDGRKIGLDQRLMNPLLPDFEGSKVNACMENVYKIWEETAPERLTQLIFCDFSTPNKDGRFNVYDDIRSKLLEKGVPPDEIAFIHDANTDTQKKELFAKVRQGKVRILLGSTFKMGAGTNVQDRLIASHDLDCPWRPADLEQRSGRIIRQGNNNEKVTVYRYATEATFDSYLWQSVQKKQEFIAQVMTSKSPVRSCEDIDQTALSYAEIKALCAGNPLIAEKMNLDNEVAKLRMLKSEYKSQQYRLEDDLIKRYPEQMATLKERIAGMEDDIVDYFTRKQEKLETSTDITGKSTQSFPFPGMTIGGRFHAGKDEAAKALLESCRGAAGRLEEVEVGEYMGFQMGLEYVQITQQINILLRGSITYKAELGSDAHGNITRINNALDKMPDKIDALKTNLENIEKQMAAAKQELTKPFAHEEELAGMEKRLAELNSELNIDDGGPVRVEMDTDDIEEMPVDIEEDEPVIAVVVKPSIIAGIRSFQNEKGSDGREDGINERSSRLEQVM